jgi:hypothetical protein
LLKIILEDPAVGLKPLGVWDYLHPQAKAWGNMDKARGNMDKPGAIWIKPGKQRRGKAWSKDAYLTLLYIPATNAPA